MLAGKQCNLLDVAIDRSTTQESESGRHESAVTLEPSPHRRVIFAIVSVGMLMASIDQTIVATALPALQHDLHTQINWASWTITVYALGRVLVLPLAGRLSDQYGRRPVFLLAIVVFTVASLCCGLVDNITLLIVLRAVQAIGGATFMPSATGMVADSFGPGRDRAIRRGDPRRRRQAPSGP